MYTLFCKPVRLSRKLSQKVKLVSNKIDQSWMNCWLFVDCHCVEAVVKKDLGIKID